MHHTEHFFGKPLRQIEAGDILRFFRARRPETRHLEFKSGEVKTEKLLKEIAAFLNSEGGLLILGAPREADIPGMVDSRSSFGEPQPSSISGSDILYRKIAESIVPVPKGIFIHQVKFNSGSIFLIEVPSSAVPPHQLKSSGTYYVREDDMSRPATHEEVERLFLKKRKADPEMRIELEKQFDALKLRLTFTNASTISAEEPGFELEVFPVRMEEDARLKIEKHRKDEYLSKGREWVEELEILPKHTVLFLSVKYYCRDVATRQKSAFVEIGKRQAHILYSFNSETDDLTAEYFFEMHSHLLEF